MTRSWASVHEVNRLYKLLARLHNRGEIQGEAALPAFGEDGPRQGSRFSLFRAFHEMTGDLTRIYGLANLDALSAKRQRTLPAACRIYDVLNFASEVATHHVTDMGNRLVQAFIGDLISREYDLEGTGDHFHDWRDFFIGSDQTTDTRAHLNRRGK